MRTTTLRICLLLAPLLCLAACGEDTSPPPGAGPAGIRFQAGEHPFGGFGIASAQPSEARLRALAPHLAKVVSFRMPDENPFDEAAVVADAGGTFEQIGVTPESLGDPAVRARAYAAFEAAAAEPERLTLFHCSSGNRAGALWALYRAEAEGASVAEALAQGRAAGLGALALRVREILEAR